MLAILLSVLLSTSPSFAEEGQKAGPCREDIQKFCKNMKPGQGAAIKCLKEYEKDLSAACKANIEKKKEEHMGNGDGGKFKAAREACKADREKFCASVQVGGGAVIKCMKEHYAELSAGCKATIPHRE